jgi:hypothetical protein
MKIKIPVSAGELVDKITILEIKSSKVLDKDKLKKIGHELTLLNNEYNKLKLNGTVKPKLAVLKKKLSKINTSLWNIEDSIRKLEMKKDFGNLFTAKARSVYLYNDKRFAVKNEINLLLGSDVTEVKQYQRYR